MQNGEMFMRGATVTLGTYTYFKKSYGRINV